MNRDSCKNTTERYGSVSRVLHWGMGLLIIGLLAMGFVMEDVEGSLKPTVYMIHKSLGVCVVFLFLCRLWWKTKNVTPQLLGTPPFWQRILAIGTHHLLYALMFLMPVSGWLMSSAFGKPVVLFNLLPLPSLMSENRELGMFFKEMHGAIAFVFVLTLVIHGGAALYHHFILKDSTLKRMMKG